MVTLLGRFRSNIGKVSVCGIRSDDERASFFAFFAPWIVMIRWEAAVLILNLTDNGKSGDHDATALAAGKEMPSRPTQNHP